MRQTIVALTVFAMSTAGWADTLSLKNGQSVQGTYLGGSAREIRMEIGSQIQSFSISEVSGLQFDASAPTPPPPDDARNYRRNNAPPSNYPETPPRTANDSESAGITIPAGTLVTIRMIDAVDSDSTRLGTTYRASVDEPVVVNNQVIIPRGAEALTKVVAEEQSGKIQGQTSISLVLQSLTVNGRPVDVTSGDVTQASGSRGARSAKVIGGTAALGTIIGAIAGGGRGAAIGAASGAAVGTGAQVATHGQRVHIPSESRLTFTLTYPVSL